MASGVALAACTALALAVFYFGPWPRGPLWDKYQRVQLGMSEEEVKDILGSPSDHEGGGLMDLDLTWIEGNQLIGVTFDPDGKAIKKRFHKGPYSWREPEQLPR
jgi:hypothetical protein